MASILRMNKHLVFFMRWKSFKSAPVLERIPMLKHIILPTKRQLDPGYFVKINVLSCWLQQSPPTRNQKKWNPKTQSQIISFYRTRVRSSVMLVSDWLTDWLTDSLTNSCLVNLIDVTLACECQLKTCWGSYCCSCWYWGSCWQQFVTDFEAEVWSWS